MLPSSSGRTVDFHSANAGSIPAGSMILHPMSGVQVLVSSKDILKSLWDTSLFGYTDYNILIIVIVICLALGLFKFSSYFKTNSYLLTMVAILSYMVIKSLQGIYYEDAQEKFMVTVLMVLGLLFLGYLLLINEEQKVQAIRFEYPVMIIMVLFGILLLMENSEGLLIFLGLELQAFTFYTMVSLREKEIFSAEGALKYFLIGALASGLFILGLGLLYGYTGQTNFSDIVDLIGKDNVFSVKLGGLLIITSLLFKIGAAPFHLWLPDAYQGAPFYVLLFLITFPKIALYYLIFTLNNILEQNMVILIGILASSILGAIQATVQTKITRFIAYTIIFNNSFFLSVTMLAGKTAFFSLLQSLILYLILGLTTALSFFLLVNSETKQRLLSLRDLISIKKSNIFVSLVILLGFFSAAGIPPFLGFFQKYLILLALTENFQIFLMVFLIISSMIPAYYYLRMSKIMYFLNESTFILLTSITRIQASLLSFLFITLLAVVY